MVRREMAQHHIRGLSLVVVSDRQTLFSRGYGLADVSRGIPAATDTVYPDRVGLEGRHRFARCFAGRAESAGPRCSCHRLRASLLDPKPIPLSTHHLARAPLASCRAARGHRSRDVDRLARAAFARAAAPRRGGLGRPARLHVPLFQHRILARRPRCRDRVAHVVCGLCQPHAVRAARYVLFELRSPSGPHGPPRGRVRQRSSCPANASARRVGRLDALDRERRWTLPPDAAVAWGCWTGARARPRECC